jgi:hypothetical protein
VEATTHIKAQGWYTDPFGRHAARWFSDGRPTALVRDDGVDSNDPPPTIRYSGPLEPVAEAEGELLHAHGGMAGDATVNGIWDIFVSTGGD